MHSVRSILSEAYCQKHGFHHGAEATELRERIEKAIADADGDAVSASRLEYILGDVDARDSLAYEESKESDTVDHQSVDPRAVSWVVRGEVRMRKARFFVHHSDDASDAPLSGIALGTTGTLRCTFEPDEEA